MGNKGVGGPFAPIVVVVRDAMGQKEFNKFRGKAISIHSGGTVHDSPAGSALPRLPCAHGDVLDCSVFHPADVMWSALLFRSSVPVPDTAMPMSAQVCRRGS